MNRNNDLLFFISCILSCILRKLGIIVICLLVSGMGLDIYRTLTYRPQYRASMSAALKLEQNTYSQLQAASSYITTLEYILNGQVVKNEIMEKMDTDSLDMHCYVTSQNNTNIVSIQVISPTKKEAYYSLKYLIDWYKNNAEKYHLSYQMDVLEKETLNDTAINLNSHFHNFKWGVIYCAVALFVFLSLYIYLRSTIKNAADIERYLDCRLFSKIPKEKKSKKRKKHKDAILVTSLKTSFAYKEAVKKLRNRFEVSSSKHGYKTVMITSSVENEGKSTIAANLALSLCKNNKKVLLIDADLRKPSLHKIFSIKTSKTLNHYLKGQATWQSQIQYLNTHHLCVLCARQELKDTEVILQRMYDLICEAKNEFDYIIIDSSPAYGINEPILMNEWADASFLVVKQNEASVQVINETIARLVQAKNNLIGCIYNSSILDFTQSNKVYGYRYGYSYYSRRR